MVHGARGGEVAAANASAQGAVLAVNGAYLNQLLDSEPLLVVFWAYWCPSCQHYVMAGDGSPIETLHRKLHVEAGGPRVVKYDVAKDEVPFAFQEPLMRLPAIRLGKKDFTGMIVVAKYNGDPYNYE